jgi:membrane fusion protein (multidrug efflux system)
MNSSTIRSIISIVFSLILLIVSFLLAQKIAGKQKTQEAIFEKDKQMVFVDTVVNEDVAVQINATGNLQAQQRIEIFAEVQGVFKKGSNPFKPGQYYSSGSTLIYIENDEYSSSLQAARSNLYNQIVAAIPDLKLDYPQQAAKWENYLQNFNPSSKLRALPSFDTDQEKYFINSRGIINPFFKYKIWKNA